jgi:glycosyltransferase involved in cell wall biosynthesis
MLRKGDGGGGYLAFLGRISPEKRPDRAIRIARDAGILLKIAAKVDKADTDYFSEVIEPMLGPGVEFVGEITDRDKQEFLGNARALMFPIDWPEPFGLVMIEAMACGTPVIAFRCGSVPEIVDDGVTGRIVASEDEAVAALMHLDRIDRSGCRRRFEERFTDTRMANDYVRVYAQLRAHALAGPVRAAAA